MIFVCLVFFGVCNYLDEIDCITVVDPAIMGKINYLTLNVPSCEVTNK